MERNDYRIFKFARNKGYRQDRAEWEHYAIGRNYLKEQRISNPVAKGLVEDVRIALRNPCRPQESDWTDVPLPMEWVMADGAMLTKCRFNHHVDGREWECIKDAMWLNWYNPWEDGRDCTGVRFTTSMRLYNLADGTAWVYHWTALDI